MTIQKIICDNLVLICTDIVFAALINFCRSACMSIQTRLLAVVEVVDLVKLIVDNR